ncbi:MAG: AI-2E family transporter [Flavobacteria bacterium RIFCSPLOWO2_12_FULL_35_11]|nr:MAG: AI-2E family transporter [Flavobacteria bacterium RIFCSPLOWO2_12_FULL_35_11]
MKSTSETDKNESFNLPFYVKTTILLIGIFAFVSMLYIAQDIIVPLIFSVMIAILLYPIVNFFVRMKINRVIAIIFTLFLTILITASLTAFLFNQANIFADSWPIMIEKFSDSLNEFTQWGSHYFDLNQWKVNRWVKNAKADSLTISSAEVGQTMFALGNSIIVMLLVPVYVFLLLYYKKLIIEFIHRVFVSSDQNQISKIISETKTVIQRYLAGLVIEAIIVAILNTAALFALGIEYAILLGIIGALLNVIPYIGGLVAVALPMAVALATKTSGMYALYVLGIYYIIQLIDNNLIVPLVVSSKVKINALFAIIVVFAGNALWGISGMFLSIPLLAIIKVIFDHIEPLKPWGFLLGDTMPENPIIRPIIKKIKNKIL